MSVVVVTPPSPVLTPAEVRGHLAGAVAGDDTLIAGLIGAATQWLDTPHGWLGRAIGRQVLEMTCDQVRCEGIALPFPPFHGLVEIGFVDASGDEQLADLDDFRVTGGPERPMLMPARGKAWPPVAPGPDALRVRWSCGWQVEDVPEPIRLAIILKVRGQFAAAKRDPRLRRDVVEGIGDRSYDTSGEADKVNDRAAECLLAPFRMWGT